MNRLYFLINILVVFILMAGCKSNNNEETTLYNVEMEDHLSSSTEFRQALQIVDSLIMAHHVKAYLDTLQNGEPDPNGKSTPLIEFVSNIIAEFDNNNAEAAINDIFHFDGSAFSLISFLIKAERVGDITPAQLAEIISYIPLPTLRVPNFVPPVQPVLKPPPLPQVCPCDPRVKIKVSYDYRPPCGNYTKKITGYAASNTLSDMQRGTIFRLDAEVEGCSDGGTWTKTVDTDGLTSYGYSSTSGQNVSLLSESAGTFTVTFTYTCGCGCGRTNSKTFTLSFK